MINPTDQPTSQPPARKQEEDKNENKLPGYLPFKEEKRVAGNLDKFRFNFMFGIKYGSKLLINKIRLAFKKITHKNSPEGFLDTNFHDWVPDESLKSNQITRSTPYQLAQSLGFQMTPFEVVKELDRVPTRIIKGKVVKGAHEGKKQAFKNALGLLGVSRPVVTPFSEALSLNAGTTEGYSIGTHSMMVVQMFDQHLLTRFEKNNKFEGIVTPDQFRIFLMLHDVGKGLSVAEEGLANSKIRKEKELKYCQQAIDGMVEAQVFSEELGNLFKALLHDVTIGKFLTGQIDVNTAAKDLEIAMTNYDVNIDRKKFFALSKLFHLADAGAYKNLRQISGLFEYNTDEAKMRHARTDNRNRQGAGAKLKNLFKAFQKREIPSNDKTP